MTHPNELASNFLTAAGELTRRLDRALSSIKGVSYSEYHLLATLASRPGASATRVDLADGVGLTPSGVTRALKPLERLGLVTTARDDRDARRSLAVLTPAGAELVDDAATVVDDTLAKIEAFDLDEADQRWLANWLRQVANG